MGTKAKHPKRGDLLEYTNLILHTYWLEIMKKLGLDRDVCDTPEIMFCKGSSHIDPEFENNIFLNYYVVLKAYKKKSLGFQGLKIPYESLCWEDVIHESVHYVQEKFFHSVFDEGFDCATEGLAKMVSFDIILRNGEYLNPVVNIADMFHKISAEYNDYFKLPKKYNKHIEKILRDKNYKAKIFKKNAAGFVYICQDYSRAETLIDLLSKPFSDKECYQYLGLD